MNNHTAAIPAEYHLINRLDGLSANGAPVNPARPSDISPLGLSLQIGNYSGSDYIDLLLREMDYYADHLDGRPVQQIWLQGAGLATITPAELTRLTYQTGSRIQANNQHHCEYGIEICHSQINPQNLALLQGLHFQQLRIHFGSCHLLSQGDWIGQIAENIELLDSAGFDEIHCQVRLGEFDNHDEIKKLLFSLQLYNPQQVELSGVATRSLVKPSQQNRKFYLGLLDIMTQRGYQLLGNHLLVSADSRLNRFREQQNLAFTPWGFCPKHLTRWLGLGLSASGYTGGYYYRNTDSLSEYQASLTSSSAPYHWHGLPPGNQLNITAIVQSLFCYGMIYNHQLDTMSPQLQTAVQAVISDACERLWLEPEADTWRLTPCGIVYLRHFFDRLVNL